jgi:hypothetical protein
MYVVAVILNFSMLISMTGTKSRPTLSNEGLFEIYYMRTILKTSTAGTRSRSTSVQWYSRELYLVGAASTSIYLVLNLVLHLLVIPGTIGFIRDLF